MPPLSPVTRPRAGSIRPQLSAWFQSSARRAILWQTCRVFSYRKSMVWTMSFGKKSSTVQSTSTRIFRSNPGNFPR